MIRFTHFLLLVRLSDSMGYNGHGKLQVWNLINYKWNSVCGEKWIVPDQSEQVCQLLGYKRSNETRIQDETDNNWRSPKSNAYSNSLITLPKQMYFLNRKPNEDYCKNTATSVHIKCESFG